MNGRKRKSAMEHTSNCTLLAQILVTNLTFGGANGYAPPLSFFPSPFPSGTIISSSHLPASYPPPSPFPVITASQWKRLSSFTGARRSMGVGDSARAVGRDDSSWRRRFVVLLEELDVDAEVDEGVVAAFGGEDLREVLLVDDIGSGRDAIFEENKLEKGLDRCVVDVAR